MDRSVPYLTFAYEVFEPMVLFVFLAGFLNVECDGDDHTVTMTITIFSSYAKKWETAAASSSCSIRRCCPRSWFRPKAHQGVRDVFVHLETRQARPYHSRIGVF